MGALISKEHREKVLSYIKLAEAEGLKISCGYGIDSLDLEPGNQQVNRMVLFTVIVIITPHWVHACDLFARELV
jgi:acyl-CoA reductase-like NAD-dependent aldehyde dehydrogenase